MSVQVLGGRVEHLAEAWDTQQEYGDVQQRISKREAASMGPAFSHFVPGMGRTRRQERAKAAKEQNTSGTHPTSADNAVQQAAEALQATLEVNDSPGTTQQSSAAARGDQTHNIGRNLQQERTRAAAAGVRAAGAVSNADTVRQKLQEKFGGEVTEHPGGGRRGGGRGRGRRRRDDADSGPQMMSLDDWEAGRQGHTNVTAQVRIPAASLESLVLCLRPKASALALTVRAVGSDPECNQKTQCVCSVQTALQRRTKTLRGCCRPSLTLRLRSIRITSPHTMQMHLTWASLLRQSTTNGKPRSVPRVGVAAEAGAAAAAVGHARGAALVDDRVPSGCPPRPLLCARTQAVSSCFRGIPVLDICRFCRSSTVCQLQLCAARLFVSLLILARALWTIVHVTNVADILS